MADWLTSVARTLRPAPSRGPTPAAVEPTPVRELAASYRFLEGEDTASYFKRLIREIENEGADCAAAYQLINREVRNLPNPEDREHAGYHVIRYLTSYAITPKGPGVLVDFAANPIYGTSLQTLKGWNIQSIPQLSFDCEFNPLPFADESVDGVMICERLELFAVDPLFCFIEINRILKPDGFVVLTTPNAVSWYSIYRALNQEHPSRWPVYALDAAKRHKHIHVREYLVAEVEQLLGAAGFGRITTFTRDYAIQPPYRPIQGVSTEHRGETIFSRAHKVGPPRKRALQPLYLEDVDFADRDRRT